MATDYKRLDKTGLQYSLSKLKTKLATISGTTLTGTLAANATKLTLSNSAIKTSSLIDIYTNVWGYAPTAVTVTAGKIVMTFTARSASTSIKVVVK